MASGYSDLSEIRKDTSSYAAYHKPPKINLLNEKPRRESLVEQQLSTAIVRPTFDYELSLNQQQQVSSINLQHQQVNLHTQPHQVHSNGSQHYEVSTDLQSPWSRPRVIREPRREPAPGSIRRDPKWIKEYPATPPSRPTSRASSTRSTTEADVLEKAAKLLQDAEELERKPLNTQRILIEAGARGGKQSPTSSARQQEINSIHTAVIKVPNYEVDNKSPLPFAYDNFSTLGVRGNIASVGAAEPESPYPPIFPQIKRTPSPTNRRI